MDNIFLILFLLTPILILIGMAKPSLFNRFLKKELSRIKLFFVLLGLGIIFLILFAITTGPSESASNIQVDRQEQTEPVARPEISPSSTPEQFPEVSGIKDETTPSPSPTLTPTKTPTATKMPTPKPTTKSFYTPSPTTPPAVPTYICNCSKTCTQISSCEEAYYLLNTCGCTRRDGDKDGVPCENICPGG